MNNASYKPPKEEIGTEKIFDLVLNLPPRNMACKSFLKKF